MPEASASSDPARKAEILPEIRRALDALAAVAKDAPEAAEIWRTKLPGLSRRLAKAGIESDAGMLARIVRENWPQARIETLFRENAGEATQPRRLTYHEVVAKLPAPSGAQEDECDEDDAFAEVREALNGRRRGAKKMLTWAQRVRDPAALQAYLEKNPYSSDRKRAITACIRYEAWDTLSYLYRHGTDKYVSILNAAAEVGNLAAFKHLHDDCRIPTEEIVALTGPLWHAAEAGKLDIVRYCCGLNPPQYNIGVAFRRAAEFGHMNVVNYLLDTTQFDEAGIRRGLETGISTGNMAILRHFEQKGAALSQNLDHKLWTAVNYGQPEMVRYLCEKYHADPRGDNHSALSHALEKTFHQEREQIVAILLNYGADAARVPAPVLAEVERIKEPVARWYRETRFDPPYDLLPLSSRHFNAGAYAALALALRSEGILRSEATRYAYDAAMLFGSEHQAMRYLERWGQAGKQPLHDLIYDIKCPQGEAAAEWNRKAWCDAVMAQGPKMARLVKFADRRMEDGSLFEPLRASDGKISLALTMRAAGKFAYRNGARNPEWAALCMEHLLTEPAFELGLKVIQPPEIIKTIGKFIPEIDIDGTEFGMPGARWRRLAPGDLRGLVLGEYTDCCQSLGGYGQDCAHHGYASSWGGFYVLEDERQRIIGQSWAWRGKDGELVLDSLESRKGRVAAQHWRKLLRAFAAKLAQDSGDVTQLCVGKGGNTPGNLRFRPAAQAAAPYDYKGYRDSAIQYRVAAFTPSAPMPKLEKNQAISRRPSRPAPAP